MPKLKPSDVKRIKFISLDDMAKKMDRIQNMDTKRRFAIEYILKYDKSSYHEYSLAEIIQFAKAKLVEPLYQNDVNLDELRFEEPAHLTKEEEVAFNHFLANPVEHIKAYNTQNYSEYSAKQKKDKDDFKIIGCSQYMSTQLDNEVQQEIDALDTKYNYVDTKIRYEQHLGGKERAEEIINKTKPGFFSRLFNTTSLAGRNLDTAFKNFNNPNSAYYGDLGIIYKASNEYLEHKFPGWSIGMPLPSEAQINALDETSKAKVQLSIALIKASDEQQHIAREYKVLNDDAKSKNITFDEVKQADEAIANENQQEVQLPFQEQLREDIDINDNNLINNEPVRNNNEIEKDDLNESLESDNDNDLSSVF